MRRRDFVLAALLGGALTPALAAVRPRPPVGNGLGPVNGASALGMHALRAARAWVQIGLDVDAAGGMRVLSQSLKAFEQGYAEFRSTANRAGLQELPMLMEQRWRAFAISAGTQPAPAGARRVLPLSEDLFNLSEKAASELALRSGKPVATLLVKAGRARALSQQLARFALSRRWGVAPADAPIYLDKSRAEFPRLLAELLAQSGNTPDAIGQIQLLQQQWVFYDKALASTDDPAAPATVVIQSERFLEVTQKLVASYV